MATERESLRQRSGTTIAQKQPVLSLTADSKSNAARIKTPSQPRTCVGSTNLLPSKFDKPPCRPLPPLEGTGLQAQRNDSQISFKPAKLTDHRSQPSLPLKGQHVFNVPTDNCGIQTAHHITEDHTAAQHEAECTESKHSGSADDFGLAKNKSNNHRLSARLQRSRSVSRLSGSSSISSNMSPRNSASVSSDTRPVRSTTPQQLPVKKNAGTAVHGQVSGERVSANNESESAVAGHPRRRSSSVSSSARVSLQRTMDKLLKITTSCESSESRSTQSNHRYRQPVRSRSLEQDMTDALSYKAKPLDNSSSNHGILGGKSDDGVKSVVVDIEQKSLPDAARCCSVVCVNDVFLFVF